MSYRRTLLSLATLAAGLLLVPLCALAVMPGDPNEAESNSRGFDPSKVYGSFDIDHVDLFSGSLRITIPIGQEYPVDGALSYGLTLVYNSSVFSYHPIPEDGGEVSEAVPNPLSNAGLGWMVTFGRLIPPDTDVLNEDLDHWLYVAPDGGQHMLYDTLHEEDSQV